MIYCYLLNSSIVVNVNVSANMNSVEMKQTNYSIYILNAVIWNHYRLSSLLYSLYLFITVRYR